MKTKTDDTQLLAEAYETIYKKTGNDEIDSLTNDVRNTYFGGGIIKFPQLNERQSKILTQILSNQSIEGIQDNTLQFLVRRNYLDKDFKPTKLAKLWKIDEEESEKEMNQFFSNLMFRNRQE
jgi:hypothetical protein